MVRLGLVALATDMTIEGDFARLFPPGVALHTTRVRFANPTTPENLRAMAPHLAEAAALLIPDRPLAAICFGCTAASALIGDEAVARAIGEGKPGVPVVTPTSALAGACTALGVRRLAVLTPYLPETTGPFVAHLEGGGLEVVRAHCLGLADDRAMAHIAPREIVAAARAADDSAAEALFLSCTALPALGLIDEIEAMLGKPVLSSNQVAGWAMLGHAGRAAAEPAGRLFSIPAAA